MASTETEDIQILLADADTVFCVSARRLLERHGFNVTIAHDGSDLLARFTPDRYDVVIAGLSLRRPNGLDILRHVKRASPNIPVILLCDEKSLAAAQAALNEGASAFVLTSQEKIEGLVDTVIQAIESSEATNAEEEPIETVTAVQEPVLTTTNDSLPLMRQLIRKTLTQPIGETLQFIADASAQILNAGHAVVLLFRPSTGFQIATAYETDGPSDAVREFIERKEDGFAYRVASAGKTLLDAMPSSEEGLAPLQFVGTPIIKEQMVGVLVAYALPPDQPMDLDSIAWLELFAAQSALALELGRIKDENTHLAPNDPTAGVLKREVFIEMADREFRRSWRYNHALTMIVIDIDGMSVINLKYGQEFGNVVLREVANVCRSIVRSVDIIGRHDADSLALLLLMTGHEGARIVAERLRVGINSIKLAASSGQVQITATIGVCSYPRNGCASVYDLIGLTQEAQQTARRLGPNQIVYA